MTKNIVEIEGTHQIKWKSKDCPFACSHHDQQVEVQDCVLS